MSKIKSLPGSRLCSNLPQERIPWETSNDIPRNGHRKVAPQPRALKALELALHIPTAGYNVYLSGESNLGRTTNKIQTHLIDMSEFCSYSELFEKFKILHAVGG